MSFLDDIGSGIADFGGGVADVAGDLWHGAGQILTGGAGDAADALKRGIDKATANTNASYDSLKGLYDPYSALGTQAAGMIPGMLGPQAQFGRTAGDYSGVNNPNLAGFSPAHFQGQAMPQLPGAFQPGQFDYKASPGLEAQTKAVTDAVQKSAAARGMLGSTNTTRQIAQQVGNTVAQDYGNEFNRFMQGQGLQQGAQSQAFGQALGAQGQAFGQGLQGFNANQDAAQQGLNQGNINRNFGYGQFRDELGDYTKQNQSQYDRILDSLGLGLRGAVGQQGLVENKNQTINDLIAQRSNATAAATKANYGAPGKILAGAGDLAKNAGQLATLFA